MGNTVTTNTEFIRFSDMAESIRNFRYKAHVLTTSNFVWSKFTCDETLCESQ